MPRSWEGLKPGLSLWMLEAVHTMGYDSMTPVQAATIPLFMGNKDVVVEAVTGSGKTLAFLIPVIERLCRLDEPTKRHHIAAIVLSPTRELATQIYSVLESLLAFHPARNDENDDDGQEAEQRSGETQRPITSQLLLGGTTTNAQDIKDFLKASPNLIVATPGKLAALLSSSRVFCPQSSFEVLVLDEADRLLDLGFKTDLQKIMAQLPKQRRTGLFSASVSEAVGELVRAGLRNPVKISVKVKSTTSNAEQRTPASLSLNYLIASPRKRLLTISKILSSLQPTPQKAILYVSTCAAVDYFRHIIPLLLPSAGGQPIELIPLHGKYRAKTRQKNFSRFLRSTTPALLLTTDVAARGLDIPEVDLVLQLDPPKDPAIFLHRCGRAGRAGRKGSSIVFIQPGREEEYVDYLGIRGTPVTRLGSVDVEASDDEVDRAERKIRQKVLSDRAIHDKAQRAFVSWVRAYREHQAGSIFRVSDLDWESLGKAWGLLRLPRMPELKQWDGDKFLGVEIDMKTYSYKDKVQEKQRLAKLAELSSEDQNASKPEARPTARQSWSQKSEEREQKEVRREKVKRKRDAVRIDRMTTEEKQQEAETLRLVEEVKRRKLLEETPWNGFED